MEAKDTTASSSSGQTGPTTPPPRASGWWGVVERVQAGSGLGFGLFLGLHLANAWLAPLGQVAYDELLAVLRVVYQGHAYPAHHPHHLHAIDPPPSSSSLSRETAVVLLPLGLHALTSMALVYRRLQQQQQEGGGEPSVPRVKLPWHLALHRYTGYVAAAMVVGHVLATRGPTWWAGHAPADFSTIAFTMTGPLGPLYFLYYILFPSAAAYHSLYGIGRALKVLLPAEWTYRNRFGWVRALFRVEKGHAFNVAVFASTALSVLAALAFAGYLFPILDKERYMEHWQMHSLYIPSFLLPSPASFDR